MIDHVEIRRGAYHDSVSLMQVSRAVQDSPGIRMALVAMATELNLELLAGMGLMTPEDAGPNDLLIALQADDEGAVRGGVRAMEEALVAISAQRPGSGLLRDEAPARTTRTAAARIAANLAVISVPGRHAFTEAMDALDSDLSVMIFSDNVPVEQEIVLKDVAADRNLLVMGPDCGTAALGGLGLGFANVVRPGRIGLVAASGTGAQEVMCLLDAAGVGVSHCLGVGGRDLSSAVGGRSTRQALAALDADPGTDLIVIVSKPPADEVANEVRALAEKLTTPVHFALLGPGRPDLTAVTEEAVRAMGGHVPVWPTWLSTEEKVPRTGVLRGLFSGGTLCDEAMLLATSALGPIASNIPLRPEWALPDDLRASGHAMIDFGDDRLTQGRPHPMIDPTLRLNRFSQEASDPSVGVILMDVVLGYGAHEDPATGLAAAIRSAHTNPSGRHVAIVVSLCGTVGDPQGLDRQATILREAGACVFLSNAAAARHAVSLVRQEANQ